MLNELIARLGLDAAEFEKGIDGISNDFDKAATRFRNAGLTLSAAISAPIIGLGAASLESLTGFEGAMNRVQVLGEFTANQMKGLEDLSIKLGADTVYSAKQAAEAMGEFVSAGFTAEETSQAMAGVLGLAAAGQLDLADAALISSDILRGYNIPATDAGKVADILAKASADSAAGVKDLGYAFKYIGPIASTLGQSLQDTTGALESLASAGIRGEKAGTALVQFFNDIANPSKKASEQLHAYNIKLKDAHGNMLPLPALIDQFSAAQANAKDKTQFFADMAQIWGARVADILPLITQGGDKIREFSAKLQESEGYAQKAGEGLMKGLGGALQQFTGSWETFTIQLGKSLEPAATAILKFGTDLVNTLTGWATEFQKLPDPVKNFSLALVAIPVAIGPAMVAMSGLLTATSSLVGFLPQLSNMETAFSKMGSMASSGLKPLMETLTSLRTSGFAETFPSIVSGFTAFKDGLTAVIATVQTQGLLTTLKSAEVGFSAFGVAVKLSMLEITAIIAGIAALVAAGIFLYNNWDDVVKTVSALWKDLSKIAEDVFGGIKDYLEGVWKGVTDAFSDAWDGVTDFFSDIWGGIKDLASDIWGDITDFFDGDDIFGTFGRGTKILWEGISDFLGDTWDAISDTAVKVWEGITDFLGDIWDGIASTFSKAWGAIEDFLGGTWKAIKDTAVSVWDSIVNWLSNKITAIANLFPETAKAIKSWGDESDTAKTKVKGLDDAGKGAEDRAKALAEKMKAAHDELLRGAKDVMPDHTDKLTKTGEAAETAGGHVQRFGDKFKTSLIAADEWMKQYWESWKGGKIAEDFGALALKMDNFQKNIDFSKVKVPEWLQDVQKESTKATTDLGNLQKIANEFGVDLQGVASRHKQMSDDNFEAAAKHLENMKTKYELLRSSGLVSVQDLEEAQRKLNEQIGNFNVKLAAELGKTDPWKASRIQFDTFKTDMVTSIDTWIDGIKLTFKDGLKGVLTDAFHGDFAGAIEKFKEFGGNMKDAIIDKGFNALMQPFQKLVEGLGTIFSNFVENIINKLVGNALNDLVTNVIPKVGSAFLGSLGSGISGLFGGGAQAAGGAVGAVGSAAGGVGSAAGSVASGVAGAASGIMGALSGIGAIGSFATGIISIFQNRSMGQDMGRIEENTRYSAINSAIQVERIIDLHTLLGEIKDRQYDLLKILGEVNDGVRIDVNGSLGNQRELLVIIADRLFGLDTIRDAVYSVSGNIGDLIGVIQTSGPTVALEDGTFKLENTAPILKDINLQMERLIGPTEATADAVVDSASEMKAGFRDVVEGVDKSLSELMGMQEKAFSSLDRRLELSFDDLMRSDDQSTEQMVMAITDSGQAIVDQFGDVHKGLVDGFGLLDDTFVVGVDAVNGVLVEGFQAVIDDASSGREGFVSALVDLGSSFADSIKGVVDQSVKIESVVVGVGSDLGKAMVTSTETLVNAIEGVGGAITKLDESVGNIKPASINVNTEVNVTSGPNINEILDKVMAAVKEALEAAAGAAGGA